LGAYDLTPLPSLGKSKPYRLALATVSSSHIGIRLVVIPFLIPLIRINLAESYCESGSCSVDAAQLPPTAL